MNLPIDTYLHICDYLDDDQVLDLYKENAVPKDYIMSYRDIPLNAFIRNDVRMNLELFDVGMNEIDTAISSNNSYYFYKLLEYLKIELDDNDIDNMLEYAIYDKENYDFGRYALEYLNLDINKQYHYHLIMEDYDYILSIMDVFDFNVPNEYFDPVSETIFNGSIPVIDKMLNSLHQEIDMHSGVIDSNLLYIIHDYYGVEKIKFLLTHPKINFEVFSENEVVMNDCPEIWILIINAPRCPLEDAMTFGVGYDQYDLIERRKNEINDQRLIQHMYDSCFEDDKLDMLKFLMDRFEFIALEYQCNYVKDLTEEMASYLVNHKNYDKEKNIEFTNLLQQNFDITT